MCFRSLVQRKVCSSLQCCSKFLCPSLSVLTRCHSGWNIGPSIKNPGSNPLAAVPKFAQFCSLHVASVQSAVEMSSWL